MPGISLQEFMGNFRRGSRDMGRYRERELQSGSRLAGCLRASVSLQQQLYAVSRTSGPIKITLAYQSHLMGCSVLCHLLLKTQRGACTSTSALLVQIGTRNVCAAACCCCCCRCEHFDVLYDPTSCTRSVDYGFQRCCTPHLVCHAWITAVVATRKLTPA